MNADQMIRFFDLVGEILVDLGAKKPYGILLIGGGYMIIQIGNRELTKDIDCIFTTDVLHTQDHIFFSGAIRVALDEIAAEFPCEFTDSFGDHIQSITQLPECRLWLKTGMLEVYVPTDRYILALKLEAARRKDMNDIQALFQRIGISTRKEAERVVAEFYYPWVRRGRAREFHDALDRVFKALNKQSEQDESD